MDGKRVRFCSGSFVDGEHVYNNRISTTTTTDGHDCVILSMRLIVHHAQCFPMAILAW